MKLNKDERGRTVRIYEAGDGIRRRFYDALDDSRFNYPRGNLARHAQSWYCDGHLAGRPVVGIYNHAKFAEHLLASSRAGRGPDIRVAARYFAATRRAMRSVLAHYGVTRRLGPRGTRATLTLYTKLCELAKETVGLAT